MRNFSKTIKNLIYNKNNNTHTESRAGLYEIHVWIVIKIMSVESAHSIKKWIYEYIRDLKKKA